MRLLLNTLLAVITGITCDAQVSNNGIFFVSNSTPVYLGDFTNSGSFTNNGTTHLTGNVINNQSNMPAGSGTVIFDGSGPQTLSGNLPFRAFNITMNNAAGLTLSNRLAIGDGSDGNLTFTAGDITSGNNTQDVYFYPGSDYTGYSNASHIVGYVTKSGNSAFTFPIGNGTRTAQIRITGLSGNSDFQTLYTGAGYGAYSVTPPLIAGGVFAQEWWDLVRTAGSASARITLSWDDSRQKLNHSNPGSLVVAHRTGGTWVSVGGTSSNAANNTTGSVGPSNPVNTFSPFTFGSTAVALPIVLTDFTVVDENCKAYLSWTTSLEQNAAQFDIQQSADGINFTTVTTVRAADSPTTYHLSVAQPTQQAFYRLRLVDLDGTGIYSTIDGLTLGCLPATDHLALYPNPVPAGGVLQARLTTPVARGAAQIQVFDGAGRKMYSNGITINAGSNEYMIPVSGFVQGIYSVVVIGDGWKSEVVLFSR